MIETYLKGSYDDIKRVKTNVENNKEVLDKINRSSANLESIEKRVTEIQYKIGNIRIDNEDNIVTENKIEIKEISESK